VSEKFLISQRARRESARRDELKPGDRSGARTGPVRRPKGPHPVPDYYTFRTVTFTPRRRGVAPPSSLPPRLIVAGKPGVWSWEAVNPGTAALIEVLDLEPDAQVLDLGCGTGVLGLAAALMAPEGRVTLVDCNVAAVETARRTLALNGVTNAEVRLGDGVLGLSPNAFDVVVSHLPRGRAVIGAFIQGAAAVLRPGGRFYFVAHRDAGIRPAILHAEACFGKAGVIHRKKGYHVAMARKPEGLEVPLPEPGYVTRTVEVAGRQATLVSKPGLFAWDRLDEGTAALIEAMEVRPGERVLDLGCGTGLVGLVAAWRGGQVTMVDADVRAIEAARRTLEANGVEGVRLLLSDIASVFLKEGPRKERFDVVVTNPPFHQGVGVAYEVGCQFVVDGARLLDRRGRLYVVANKFLRYDRLMARLLPSVRTVYEDNRYHVLLGERGRG